MEAADLEGLDAQLLDFDLQQGDLAGLSELLVARARAIQGLSERAAGSPDPEIQAALEASLDCGLELGWRLSGMRSRLSANAYRLSRFVAGTAHPHSELIELLG